MINCGQHNHEPLALRVVALYPVFDPCLVWLVSSHQKPIQGHPNEVTGCRPSPGAESFTRSTRGQHGLYRKLQLSSIMLWLEFESSWQEVDKLKRQGCDSFKSIISRPTFPLRSGLLLLAALVSDLFVELMAMPFFRHVAATAASFLDTYIAFRFFCYHKITKLLIYC